MIKKRVALVALLGVVLFGRPAFAQAENKAAAEALFQKGKDLMARQEYAEACSAFLESDRLDPGIGTKLRLADCYAASGKTASAWAQFIEAADSAASAADGREKVARKKAAELEPLLPKLIIAVPPEVGQDVEVMRDGMPIGKPSWGLPMPVDPGTHLIVVSAPQHESWSTKVTSTPGQTSKLTIPALHRKTSEDVRPPSTTTTPSLAAPTDRGASSWGVQRTAGVVVVGLGIVGLGLGGFFGIEAKSKLDASNADGHCRADNRCDATGVALRDDFLNAATVSTIAFVAGGVLLVGGGALYLTAPRRTTITPTAGARSGGITLQGVF